MKQVYWMTGLSGSGKTTISRLTAAAVPVEILDGDILREGICKDLKFTPEDRMENLRRAAHLAKHLAKYTEVLVCTITPYKAARDLVREIIGRDHFHLIHIKASFDTCQERDPKGLYKKVSEGLIKNFTGKEDSFDEPKNPQLVLETEKESPEESAGKLIGYIREHSGI